jgi:hypothetical protein
MLVLRDTRKDVCAECAPSNRRPIVLDVQQLIKAEVEEVKEHGGDLDQLVRVVDELIEVTNQGCNVTLKKEKRGNAPTYALRRLKRESC